MVEILTDHARRAWFWLAPQSGAGVVVGFWCWRIVMLASVSQLESFPLCVQRHSRMSCWPTASTSLSNDPRSNFSEGARRNGLAPRVARS